MILIFGYLDILVFGYFQSFAQCPISILAGGFYWRGPIHQIDCNLPSQIVLFQILTKNRSSARIRDLKRECVYFSCASSDCHWWLPCNHKHRTET